MPELIGHVATLHRFPIKSMLGERLSEAYADERGLRGDRAFAIIDVETGSVASAKHPRRWGSLLACRARFVTPPASEGALPPVRIDFPDGRSTTSDDPEVDAVLSAYLGRSVRLAAQAPPMAAFDDYWPDMDGVSPEGRRDTFTSEPVARFAPAGTFFDMSAFHVVTAQSLAALGQALPESVIAVPRFRANIEIAGVESARGFVENAWVGRVLSVGQSLAMKLLMPAMRCVMTTLAQDTLPSDAEVLRGLVRENLITAPDGKRYPCIGVYGSLARKLSAGGSIRTGDACLLS